MTTQSVGNILPFKKYDLRFLVVVLLFPALGLAPINKSDLNSQRSGKVTGRVVDAADGIPLPGANALIQGSSIGAATDAEGEFSISGVPAGEQTLVVSYIGYETVKRQISVSEGETVDVTIEMTLKGIEGKEVTISTQARGQNQAINQQLSSNTIKDVVSQARIEELPDVNAAESVGRLPGVSIQRSNGEANKVAIRGLSPKYNNININGVSVPSTGGSDRSVNLSMIAPNALAGIEVTKALLPNQDADAIGGTVNLRLQEARPGFNADARIQGGYNQIQSYFGNYKAAASVSNRFLGGNFGIIASGNIENVNRSADRYRADYNRIIQGENDEGEDIYTPRVSNIKLVEHSEERGRLGGNLVLDYQLPGGQITLNSFYSRLKSDQIDRGNVLDPSADQHDYTTGERDVKTRLMTHMLQGEYAWHRVSIELSASYSSSLKKNPDGRSYSFNERGAFSDSLDRNGTPRQIQKAAFDNIDNTYLFEISNITTESDESQSVLSGNIEVPFNIGSQVSSRIEIGGKYNHTDRSNDKTVRHSNIYHGGVRRARDLIISNTDIKTTGNDPIPFRQFVDEDYDPGNFLSGDYNFGPTSKLDPLRDASRAVQPYLYFDQGATYRNDYEGTEDLTAGYAMGEFNIGPVMILPGVRFENKETEYTAPQIVGSSSKIRVLGAGDTTTVRSNSNWFPYLHVKAEPTDWLDIRLAYTETLTRPDFLQVTPSQFINQDRTKAWLGNSDLEPSMATNYDASISLSQQHLGLLTLSGFYKRIEGLIWENTFNLVEGQNIAPGVEDKLISSAEGGEISIPLNNPNDAFYKGFEVSWQTNFWYLPSFLKGIVLNVNYTHISSETDYPRYNLETEFVPSCDPTCIKQTLTDTVRAGRLPDQPDNILNLTLGYDYKGFSARVSTLYQGQTLQYLAASPVSDRFTEEYLRFDASVRQKLASGFQVYANFNNITNRADRDYQATIGSYPTYTEYYGFTTDIGVRYRF